MRVSFPGASHFRTLAVVTPEAFNRFSASWLINGTAPKIFQLSAATIMHRTARCLCMLDKFPSEERAAQEASAAAALAASASPSKGNAAPGNLKKACFEMCDVLDQISKEEVLFLTNEEGQKCNANYLKVMQAEPDEDAKITVQQLSAFSQLLESGRNPYADFAIFGPHGTRNYRKVKLSGLVPDSNGAMRRIEFYGPPSFSAWDGCFEVYATGMIMKDTISLTSLTKYRKLMKRFAERFGPVVWPLQYQADARMRSEHFDTLFQRALFGYKRAMQASPPLMNTLDPSRPWDTVMWEAGEDDFKFWKRQLEDHALMILAKVGKLGSVLDGDAQISKTISEHLASDSSMAQLTPHAALRVTSSDAAGRPAAKQPPAKRLRSAPGQLHSVNRKGVPICGDYVKGQCRKTRGNGLACGADGTSVHQCPICLLGPHQCANPGQCNGNPTPPPKSKSQTARGKWGKGGRRSGH